MNIEHVQEEAAKVRDHYIADPCAFSREVLGREPWDDGSGSSQADVLRACANHKLVATRSGHKSGKTADIGILALWAYTLFHPSSVILTAPTFRQVQRVIWKEITKLWRGARVPLGGRLYDSPTAGIRHPSGNEVFGMSTDDPDNFSGFSGSNLFYLVDEAPGVDESIFDAIHGNRAGGASLWMFGNPTQTTGTFYDAFHGLSDLYVTFHINSEDVARFNKDGRIPGLATPEWVTERRRAWRPNSAHPMYLVRVLGQFPPSGHQNVIGLVAWEAARKRYDAHLASTNGSFYELHRRLLRLGYPLVSGLDVARFGDDRTCFSPRRGPVAFPVQVTTGRDGPEVAAWALRQVRSERIDGEGVMPGTSMPTINVDSIGVGASAYDQLAREPDVAIAVPINVSERSDDPEEYANLRAQLWFNTAQWLAEVGAVPDDDELRVELLAVRYKFDKAGRLLLEEKSETKKRIQRSPDKGDALVMAVYRGAAHAIASAGATIRVRGI